MCSCLAPQKWYCVSCVEMSNEPSCITGRWGVGEVCFSCVQQSRSTCICNALWSSFRRGMFITEVLFQLSIVDVIMPLLCWDVAFIQSCNFFAKGVEANATSCIEKVGDRGGCVFRTVCHTLLAHQHTASGGGLNLSCKLVASVVVWVILLHQALLCGLRLLETRGYTTGRGGWWRHHDEQLIDTLEEFIPVSVTWCTTRADTCSVLYIG